jgi:hypothetical protein
MGAMHGGVRDGRGGATRWSRRDDEILRVSLVLGRNWSAFPNELK